MFQYIRTGLLISAAILVSPAAAQDYPAKPIRFVITGGAGGSTDVVARVVGDKLAGGCRLSALLTTQHWVSKPLISVE